MTRRQMLVAATAGGAALAAGALGGGAVGAFATRAEYELELKKLQTLVALYAQLEKVGIDAIILTGMNIVGGALGTVKAGMRLVRDGIATVQGALKAFQDKLDDLRKATEGATQVLTDLQQRLLAAQALIGGALGSALSLTESIRNFFNSLIDKIPFGIGDNVRRAIDALVNLIRAIPSTIDVITAQLLKPLNDFFFAGNSKPAVQTSLFDPIVNNLLKPLDQFLGDVETALNRWEADFAKPVQGALEQRAQIRSQIDEYRKQNNV
jgi:hypothetical protein